MHNEPKPVSWKEGMLKIFKLKIIIIFIFIFLVAVGIRIYINKSSAPIVRHEIPSVNVVTVTQKPVNDELALPGTVEAIEQVNIYSHVSGYLKKIYVDEGDQVEKGQLIAEIDAPDAIQQYAKAQADYNLKKVTLKRYTELLNENVISKQEFDVVKADEEESKAKLDNARAVMSYTKITSPFTGSVARRYKYPGDIISNGSNVSATAPIFLIVNESKLRIALNVSQSDIAGVNVGDPVQFKVDSLPNQLFDGQISRVDALLDFSTKTQRILVDFENKNKSIQPGMFASVNIKLNQSQKNLVTVPKNAVHNIEGKKGVYILDGNKAKFVVVTTGAEDLNSVSILSGLKDSDKVILGSGGTIKDGMEVHPVFVNI
jgi:membrane fusion protein (multidrug efflux system)